MTYRITLTFPPITTHFVDFDKSLQGRRQVKQSGMDSMARVWGRVSRPKSGVWSGDTI